MRIIFTFLALMLGACDTQGTQDQAGTPESEAPVVAPAEVAEPAKTPRWELATSATGTGTGARLLDSGGAEIVTIACVSGGELRVTVPGFTRIGSEDRLSIGFDDDPIALAAEMDGAPAGVSASGAIPPDIARRIGLATAFGAQYGNQSTGPLPPPADDVADGLAKACTRMLPAG